MKSLSLPGKNPDPRFTLANERTFLAWVRTSMTMILGAIVLATLLSEVEELSRIVALLTVLLSISGSAVSIWAWLRWRKTELALRSGRTPEISRSLLVLAVIISLLGITMLAIGVELIIGR